MGLVVFATVIFLLVDTSRYGGEFLVPLQAAKRALSHGQVYIVDQLPFIYPPSSLWLYAFFASVPEYFGARLWVFLSLAGYFVAFYCADYFLFKVFSPLIRMVLLLGFLSLFPLRQTVSTGQPNLIVFGLVMAAFYFLERPSRINKNWQILAGALLALAAGIKIVPIILVVYLAYRRFWPGLLSFIFTLAATNIVALIVFRIGLSNVFLFLQLLFGLSIKEKGFDYVLASTQINQSMGSFAFDYLFRGQFITLFVGVTALILLGVVSIKRWFAGKQKVIREEKLANWEFYTFLITIPVFFFGAYTWEHHLVLLFPLLWLFLGKFYKTESSFALLACAIAFVGLIIDPYALVFSLKEFEIGGIVFMLARYHALLSFLTLFIILLVDPVFWATRKIETPKGSGINLITSRSKKQRKSSS